MLTVFINKRKHIRNVEIILEIRTKGLWFCEKQLLHLTKCKGVLKFDNHFIKLCSPP